MKPTGLMLLAAMIGCVSGQGWAREPNPNVPEGYRVLYSQDFESKDALKDFEFSDPTQWKLKKRNGNTALEFGGKCSYKPPVRSPRIIGLIGGQEFGSFVLEADLLQTGREYGHRDMCLFFGLTDPGKFYYVHIATKTDNHAHNIFIVKDSPRTKISTKTTQGVDWGKEQWHRIRLERDVDKGTIKVFYDDMSQPIMLAEDKSFPLGFIGFGSFDDTGMIDNIRIWGKKAEKTDRGFFVKK